MNLYSKFLYLQSRQFFTNLNKMETITSNGNGFVFLEIIEPKKKIIPVVTKARIYKTGGIHFSKQVTDLIFKITGQDPEKLSKMGLPVIIAFDKGEPIKKTIYIAFEKDGKFEITYSEANKGKAGQLTMVGSFKTQASDITNRLVYNGQSSLLAKVEAWKQETLKGLKLTLVEE